jgi:hypothetical protein
MLIYLFAFILLFALMLVYFRIADRFNIIDKPNDRSSHRHITLRGGGVVFYFGVLLWFLWSGFVYPWFFAGLTLIALISFTDDVNLQMSSLSFLFCWPCWYLTFSTSAPASNALPAMWEQFPSLLSLFSCWANSCSKPAI